MQALLLAAALLQTPVTKTEIIPLKYYPAVKFEQSLVSSRVVPTQSLEIQGLDFTPKARNRSSASSVPGVSIPRGIQAVSVLQNKNAIVVTGDAAGLAEIRNLVRLLDIPAKEIRLQARAVRLDAETARRFTPANPGVDVLNAIDQQALQQAITGRAAVLAMNSLMENGGGLHLNLPADGQGASGLVTVTARIHGDNTLTLLIAREGEQALVRRVRSGEVLAAPLPGDPQTVIVLRPEVSL